MSGTTKTEQKYAISKGFAEVGTEAWLRECEALLAGVPAEANTVASGKERLKGLIEAARAYRELEEAGRTSSDCPWCAR